MTKLNYEGHLIDVDTDGLYNWAVSNLISPVEIVGTIYMSHQVGNPIGGRVEHLPILERVERNLTENVPSVDHEGILHAIQANLPGLKKFIAVSNDLIGWQEINMAESDPDRIEEHFFKTGELPVEMRSGEYQELLKKSSDSLLVYLDGLEIAIACVRELSTELSKQYS